MQCKTCSYPLWQLKPGPCPECGTPFKPSDFDFVGNAVRFCCPHCQQAYYGTGEKGHLVPPEFACVSCNNLVTMDEMVLLPTEGVREEQTQMPTLPWVDRGRRSWFGAFFATTGWAMSNPNRAIDGVPLESSLRRALRYAFIHLTMQTLLGCWPLILFGMGISGAALSLRGSGTGFLILLPVGVVLALVMAVGAFFLWAISSHVILRLTGPTLGGLRRTLQVMSYSAGNNAITAIPCFGFYLIWAGALWWAISAACMLKRSQQVSGWRAAAAVVGPIVAVVLTIAGLIGWGIYSVQRFANNAFANMPASVATSGSLSSAATTMARAFGPGSLGTSDGKHPDHAIRFLENATLMAGDFILPNSSSNGKRTFVAGHSLDEWTYSRFGAKGVVLDADLRKELLTPVTAHRVGDWVFTFAGQDASKPNAKLWLAVGWPDPLNNSKDPLQVPIVYADGTTDVIAIAKFETEFTSQNQERGQAGLAPIPHPRDVRSTPGAQNASAKDDVADETPEPDGEEDGQTEPAPKSPAG